MKCSYFLFATGTLATMANTVVGAPFEATLAVIAAGAFLLQQATAGMTGYGKICTTINGQRTCFNPKEELRNARAKSRQNKFNMDNNLNKAFLDFLQKYTSGLNYPKEATDKCKAIMEENVVVNIPPEMKLVDRNGNPKKWTDGALPGDRVFRNGKQATSDREVIVTVNPEGDLAIIDRYGEIKELTIDFCDDNKLFAELMEEEAKNSKKTKKP